MHSYLYSGDIYCGKKSLAIYFWESQFRRNRIFNFIISKRYVDKRLGV